VKLLFAVLALALFVQAAPVPAPVSLSALVGAWTSSEPEPAPPNARMIAPSLTISTKDGKTYVVLGTGPAEEVHVLAPLRGGGPPQVSLLVVPRAANRWQIMLRPMGLGTLRLEMHSVVTPADGRYYEETFKKAR
jgi:hypothetical protein